MAKKKRDYVKEIRQELTKLAARDVGITSAINRFADFSVDELAGFLKMPDDSFPMHGFASKREVRLALMGNMPKKAWPAAAQAAHERVGYVIRKEDKAKSPAQHGIIGIPVLVIDGPVAAEPMIVMRRNARGELSEAKQVIDVEAADGPER